MALSLEEIQVLDLVACDFSYKPMDSIRVGDKLSSYLDSAPGDERDFPSELVTGRLNTATSPTAYTLNRGDPTAGTFTTVTFNNWVVDKKFDVPGSGFGAVVLKSLYEDAQGKYDYIVAFRGSKGTDPQDWYTNLDLAAETWKKDGVRVTDYLVGLQDVGRINFTGQSLGVKGSGLSLSHFVLCSSPSWPDP